MSDDEALRRLRHDLRTPLAIITGYADLLKTQDVTGEQRREYAERIAAAAGELRALIDDAA